MIVGGGVIGCALARELAPAGLEVALVEKRQPGAESSGAAAGLLAPQAECVAPGPFFDLGIESRGLYPRWTEELVAETGIDVGYRRTGILRCALREGPQSLDPFLWQRRAGLAVEQKDPAAIAALTQGQVTPEVHEALFFPEESIVDSRRLTRALWLSAERRGVRLLIGTAARRFLLREGACRGVETDGGAIEAERVVDAAGAWANFDPALPMPLPVRPVRGQIVELRLTGEGLPTVIQSEEVYLVPHADGSLLVGATVEFVGFEKEVTAGAVEGLIAAAARLVPAVEAARFTGARVGLRPGTPDGLPVLGPSAVPGLFFATGHFRNGILLAPVTARILADELMGGGSHDLVPFSVERFEASDRPARRSETSGVFR